MIAKKTIYLLALFTLIGFPLIGWGIHYFFSDEPLAAVFQSHLNPWLQILVGACYGWVTAWLGWLIVKSPLLRPVRKKYENLFEGFKLTAAGVIFISFCAGTGEELLFRGAIQPQLGIVVTSIGFVALHGYLHPFDWRISIYGVFMTLVIAGIGWMYEKAGIWSCISAHTVIDIFLLNKLINNRFRETV